MGQSLSKLSEPEVVFYKNLEVFLYFQNFKAEVDKFIGNRLYETRTVQSQTFKLNHDSSILVGFFFFFFDSSNAWS